VFSTIPRSLARYSREPFTTLNHHHHPKSINKKPMQLKKERKRKLITSNYPK
jgi:hypothetical protein